MKIHSSLGFLVVIALLLAGCTPTEPPAPVNVQVPDQLILYSIDGGVMGQPPVTESDEEFRGHPVLGKVDVKSAEDRRMLMTAYENGKSDGPSKACFDPRHGIRTIHQGITTEYVICFECGQAYVYSGTTRDSMAITESAKETFNKYLTDAGVPLMPVPSHND